MILFFLHSDPRSTTERNSVTKTYLYMYMNSVKLALMLNILTNLFDCLSRRKFGKKYYLGL